MKAWIEDILFGTDGTVLSVDSSGESVMLISERVAYRIPRTMAAKTIQRRLDLCLAIELIGIVAAIAAIPFSWAPLLVFPLMLVQLIIDRSIARFWARDWERLSHPREVARHRPRRSSFLFWMAVAAALLFVLSYFVTAKSRWLFPGLTAFAFALLLLRLQSRRQEGIADKKHS